MGHQLQQHEAQFLEEFFAARALTPVSQDVIDQATLLRRQRRMSLGDAILAATALVHDVELLTRNINDFRRIPTLRVRDPLA